MEKVQLNLERFLPELRDLERKNIFSKDEISDIVSKRRSLEVATSKRDVKPVDYLRYIEYEVRLEKLRKLRASRIQTTTKKTLSDHSISAHITQLHRLSIRRFPSSLPLWDAYLSHSLSQNSPLLVSRTLSAAIALHPTHVQYWIMASKWESEGDRKGMGGGNTEGARRLCMRALRFLKGRKEDEEKVWLEWLRVECAYVEKLRARWAILGIGKEETKGDEMEVEKEGEDGEAEMEEKEEVELPQGEDGDGTMDGTAKEVEAKVLSGQEAIIDGAIVRVVLDNFLTSYSHSISAHKLLIKLLRALPSPLRLPLLSHVYASLTLQHPSGSPSYAEAVHLLATRFLYDVAYDPSSQRLVDLDQIDVNAVEEIRVEGEELVDSIAEAVEVYWKACKGKKGKTASNEVADVKVWEGFCAWLEEMQDFVDEENLSIFLTTHLTSALSLSPPSIPLSLLHLRHLLRTTAPHSSILSYATSLSHSLPATLPLRDLETLLVASLETIIALSDSPTTIHDHCVFSIEKLAFSGKLWTIHAEWIERSGSVDDIGSWYETSIARVLRTDGRAPVDWQSQFEGTVEAREELPRRWLIRLLNSELAMAEVESKIERLLSQAPTLSLAFLQFVLDTSKTTSSSFRDRIYTRIVQRPEATSECWITFAGELLKRGDTLQSSEVVKRAMGTLKGGQKARFESGWTAFVNALE